MKSRICILLLLVGVVVSPLSAQHVSRRNRGFWHQEWSVENGDSIPLIHVTPIRKYARKPDMRRYARLVRAVKKTYPIAQEAKTLMAAMEKELLALPNKKQQKLYIKGVEKRLVREYTPVLKKMTFFEGKVLLKLIDRETDNTAFQIVKEFRGGFEAGIWQAFAKLFGNDLKLDYQPDVRDRQLEQVVRYYEKGLL
ncbi:MAG: DUF4294 domain-containing protein [Alistipes sp.]|jgi:hypothetical protein|nr:DUF4294 domain-containing protein [Alistipes sp.]